MVEPLGAVPVQLERPRPDAIASTVAPRSESPAPIEDPATDRAIAPEATHAAADADDSRHDSGSRSAVDDTAPVQLDDPHPPHARGRAATRPPADFVFDARPIETRRRAPAAEHGDVMRTAPAAPITPRDDVAPREPSRPRDGAPRRRVPADPLAVALASAVRWTSSDTQLPEPAMHDRPTQPSIERASGVEAPTLPPRFTPTQSAPAGPSARPEPTPSVEERVTGVHIGSIEVELVEAHNGAPVSTQHPAPTPPRSDVALARKLEPRFGLFQR